MRRYKKEVRYAICSFLCTLLILFLLAGFVIADKNTRRIGFGDEEPIIVLGNRVNQPCALSIRFMDKKYTLDFTDEYNLKKSIDGKIKSNLNNAQEFFSEVYFKANKCVEKIRFVCK